MEVDLLLRGVIAPLIAATAVLCVTWKSGTRLRGLALVTALVISCAVQEPFDRLPPSAAWLWVPIACLAAVAVGALAGERAVDRVGRAITCGLAALLACVLLPLPEWGSASSRLSLGLAMATACALLLPVGMHRGGASFWIGACMAVFATGALVLVTGFAKLAVPVAAVGATCAVAAVLSLRAPHRALHAGISGTIAIVSVVGAGCAAALAFDTSDLPIWIPVLCALAPLGLWLGEAAPFRASRVASGLARVLGVGAPACTAVIAAVLHMQRASRGDETYAVRPDALADIHHESPHAAR